VGEIADIEGYVRMRREQQGKAEEGGEGSGGGEGGAMQKWCVVCALEYITLLI
jgi:hypothetical protein